MSNNVAVFDWDNTVIKGYANDYLFSVLNESKILTEDLSIGRGTNHALYASGNLTHDRMVELNRLLLEKNFQCIKEKDVNEALKKYREVRMQFIYRFMLDSIFPYLSSQDIKIIIITGALQEVVNIYKDDINIWKLIATEAYVNKGTYTGAFSDYIATSDGKEKIIRELIQNDDLCVKFSFGDSISDIPLFKVANCAFVNNTKRFLEHSNIEYLNFDNAEACSLIMNKMMNEMSCL